MTTARFGYTEESLARLDAAITEIGTIDGTLALALPEQVELIAHEIAAAMHREFLPHDRTGKDDDPSAWNEGYVHTIDTLQVHVYGLHALIQMSGGAVFVEYKTDPHLIEGRPDGKDGGYLHFLGKDGWVRVKSVQHPGYKGDPFVERAIADVRVVEALASILNKIRLTKWASGPYSFA